MNLNLNHEGFEKYLLSTFREDVFGRKGIHYVFKFDNYYGASVIKHYGSYGYEEDLWELAVVNFRSNPDKFVLDYNTPITADVEGWLTDEEVRNLLGKIKELKWE